MIDLNKLRKDVEAVAVLAGNETLRYFRHPMAQWTKANANDVVTEADHAAEAIILPALRDLLPEAGILSEESGASGVDTGWRWLVDPIDGTVNFASGLPHYSVSIGLMRGPGDPVLGVVYDPYFDELFSAMRGEGAEMNGDPLRVTETDDLARAVLITGFASDLETNRHQLRVWGTMMERVRALRRFGSAALDICYVAAGRVDGFWEFPLNPWDIMAGLVIASEAGGVASDLQGATERLYTGAEVMVSNGRIHPGLRAALAAADQAAGL